MYTSRVDKSLMYLFYFYKNLSKNHRIKKLYQLMKGQFELYGDGVIPMKATRTRYTEHKICSTKRVVNKYRLYCQHLQHQITVA